MTFMSEVRERMTRQLAEDAEECRRAADALKRARERLHASIRQAGSDQTADKMGPSAIARATSHYYTREYIGTLLKPDADDELSTASPADSSS